MNSVRASNLGIASKILLRKLDALNRTRGGAENIKVCKSRILVFMIVVCVIDLAAGMFQRC